jgi:RNA polymerase sigma factor (sigma-70 family)
MVVFCHTSRTLLSRIKQGDEISWDEFYRIYAPLIILCGKDYRLSNADIDELVQQTVLAFFKDKNFTYTPQKGRFRDYLRTIIRHKAIDIKRKTNKRNVESSLDELPE